MSSTMVPVITVLNSPSEAVFFHSIRHFLAGSFHYNTDILSHLVVRADKMALRAVIRGHREMCKLPYYALMTCLVTKCTSFISHLVPTIIAQTLVNSWCSCELALYNKVSICKSHLFLQNANYCLWEWVDEKKLHRKVLKMGISMKIQIPFDV